MDDLLSQFTPAQLGAAIRGVLQYALGIAAAHGYITNDETTAIAASVASLIVLLYGVYKRRKDGLIKSTAHVKGVQKVVTDEKTASRIPSAKVVPPSVTVPGVAP
jgi:hypothetical protein